LAREFAKRDARVAICARSKQELDRVREEFSHSGKMLFAAVCDVGVRAEVGRLIQSVRENLGEIDIVVNNVGTIIAGPADNQETESFEEAMQNFWGPYYATSGVLERMKARRFGLPASAR